MPQVKVDFVGKGGVQGDVAAYMASQGRLDPGAMRPYIGKDGKAYVTVYTGGDPKDPKSYKVTPIQTNATLRRDEWKALDAAILPVARERLRGIEDLRSRGLVYNLANAMGTTVLEYHTVNDSMEAAISMDGVSRGAGDRPVFGTGYIPLPIVHVDYEINSRVLAASRSLGNPLDTTAAEHAARRVAEKLEDMLFTDTSYTFGGGTIYSYLNAPNRNTVTLSKAWDDATKTGAEIVDDVLALKQASIDVKHYGPWVLYVPTGYETVLDSDYDATTPGTTVRERIRKIEGISDVKVIDRMPADNVLLVEMSTSTVRLIYGMGIQNVAWSTEGNMVNKFKVMTIQVPQIRADANGNCGIVHLS